MQKLILVLLSSRHFYVTITCQACVFKLVSTIIQICIVTFSQKFHNFFSRIDWIISSSFVRKLLTNELEHVDEISKLYFASFNVIVNKQTFRTFQDLLIYEIIILDGLKRLHLAGAYRGGWRGERRWGRSRYVSS